MARSAQEEVILIASLVKHQVSKSKRKINSGYLTYCFVAWYLIKIWKAQASRVSFTLLATLVYR